LSYDEQAILDTIEKVTKSVVNISALKLVHKPFAVWMQLGIVNEEAAEAGRRAGLIVVMDRCLMIEYNRSAQRKR
jgi:predicted CoA-binding protein